MSRVLLVNPPSAIGVYDRSHIRVAITSAPFITLASLAGACLEAGHDARIADLMIEGRPLEAYRALLSSFRPDIVGITFTTPLWSEAVALARTAREVLPDVTTVAGGVHATTLPLESLETGAFDLVALGEGERTIAEICSGVDRSAVAGLAYLQDGVMATTPPRALIEDLDTLPLPAWQLHDLRWYRAPHIASRRNPVGYMETNRGCNHHCLYCSQTVFGHRVRFKTPGRVVDEMTRMLEMGFRDIHIKDNNFTADIARASEVCELMISRGFDAPWALPTGVNVRDVDEEFFRLARRAGCYQVAFGIESGVDEILARVNKRQTSEDIGRAVRMAHRAGLETVGFFMMGLPGDTEETMEETVRFACSLPLTYAKASMTLPFPSSALFRKLEKEGRILSKDWDRYNFHCTSEVWTHDNLSWDIIKKWYGRFHRRFYFRPSYIAARLVRDLRNGQLADDIGAVLSNSWLD
jgi:anaerobic magnesium-protoporphyrin IX monomethyl ester cyclase